MRKLLNSKALSVFLAIVMLIATMAGTFTFSASAGDAIPTYTADTSWYTSDAAGVVYEIDTPDELLGFSVLLRTKSFKNQTIKLTADINLNPGWDADDFYDKLVDGDSSTNGVTPPNMWTCAPIFDIVSLYGIFDGNGHTISGIYAVSASDKGTIYGRGLFGCGVGGELKNFTLVNSCYDLSSGKDIYPGGFFGQLYEGTTKITNVYSELNMYSTSGPAGAFVSDAPRNVSVGIIDGCVYNGKIASAATAAGFVGKVTMGSVTIRNSAMYGTVSQPSGVCGGIIDDIRATTVIESVIVAGSVKANANGNANYVTRNNGSANITKENILILREEGKNVSGASAGNAQVVTSGEITGIEAQAILNEKGMTAFAATTTGYPMLKAFIKEHTPEVSDGALNDYVGYQTTRLDANGKFDLRLVGNLDVADLEGYDAVGFKVVAFFENNDAVMYRDCRITTVYEEITASYDGKTSYKEAGKYLFVQECKNLTKDFGDITFEITTYSTDANGNTVDGATYRFVVDVSDIPTMAS